MRFFLPVLLCLSLCVIFSNSALAANRFWIAAAASNWNNTANWSATSGGAGGVAVPVAGDVVTFNGSGLGNCNIDVSVSVGSISVSGYTGTISQGANIIAVSTTATFGSGTFTGGSANITVTGVFTLSGTAFTSTTAVLEFDNNAVFSSGSFLHNNGTVYFNTSIAAETISGTSPAFYVLNFAGNNRSYTISSLPDITVASNLIISGGGFINLLLGNMDVSGDINITNSATGCGGTTLVTILGAGTQNFNGNTVAGTGALPQLTINKPSGTLNMTNFPGVSNNFIYTAGTLSAGTSTFCFTHGSVAAYSITGSLSLANIEFPMNNSLSTITITAGTTVTATGNLAIAGAGGLILQTGNINVNGNIILTNTANNGGGTASINIVGSGAETMDGTAIILNESRLPLINIDNVGGTLSLLGNISFSASVTYTAGTINAGTSTCYIVNNLTMTGNFSLYNITISASGGTTLTIASGNTVTATNILDLENGANLININTGTMAVQGNLVDNNTSINGGGSGTILIDGSGAQQITTTGVIDQGRFPAVTINSTGGTVTFPSLITVLGNWTYIAGTLDVTTNSSTVVFEGTLTITGSLTLNNIEFDGSNNYTFTTAAGTTLTVSGTMSIIGTANVILNTGNINLNGNLSLTNTGVGGGGTTVISFVAAVNQSISSSLPVNESCLPAITINKSGGTLLFPALITTRGNWNYTAGTIDVTTNNATVVFSSPLAGGVFTLTGTFSLNNVTFEGNNNNSLTVNTGSVLTVTGTLSTTGAFNVFINTTIGGATAIQAQGNITIGNTSVSGGGTGLILINGTGAQLFSSTSPASEGLLPYITIQKPSGTLTLSGILSESRSWTYTSGTVDATTNATTVVFGGNNLTITSAGMSFYNITFTANTSTLANNLTANNNLTISGLSVLAPGSNTINLAGNWSAWGSAGYTTATSTVNFDGSALQTISTTGGSNFTNLIVNNSSTGIQLENSAAITTALTMTQGNIDLNSNTLTLGTTAALPGTLNYTAGTMINTGTFTRWIAKATIASGSAAGLFPVGNINNYQPFNISAPTTAPTSGGTASLSYTYVNGNTLVSFPDGASTVAVIKNLNWALTTGNGLAGGTYNIEGQGTGFGTIGNVTDLRLTLVGSAIGTAGVNAGTIVDPQVNTTGLSLANLTNSFYIGSVNYANSSLPIDLVSFTASFSDGQVQLNWSTAAQINSNYFTVQKSKDAQNWDNLEQVVGDSASGAILSYTAEDPHPYSGISFYRLMLTDADGIETYSPIRTIILGNTSSLISIYPNPASDYIIITFPASGKYAVSLLNSIGQLMNGPLLSNGVSVELQVSNIKSGIYFVHIVHGDLSETEKIVINN
jgi:hypothetical protein